MSTEEIAAELMATTPDPKAVREIAHDALTIAIRRGRTEAVEAALIAHGGAGPVLGEKFDVTTNAVIVEYNRLAAALSWPDEQPQDERDAAELVATKDALNAAYRERAHLVALLAAVYPSHVGCTDPDAPGWAVVTLQLPTGQAAWHIAPDDEGLFQHVEQEPGNAIPWDGHSTEEKYRRIDELTALLSAADMERLRTNDPGGARWVEHILSERAGLPDRQAKLLAAIQREGGEWAPIRARGVLVQAGYAVTKERAHQIMKQLAARGYLEQVRPRAYTYRLKTEKETS